MGFLWYLIKINIDLGTNSLKGWNKKNIKQIHVIKVIIRTLKRIIK
jgi:hypothetical protein